MPDKDLIEIHVSRMIPASKWRVIRLMTKVWEFPSYIPNVKEVTVIHKKHNTMQTKWRVQLEGMPMTWIEEDTLAFPENAIYFKAIEGDLAEFKGKWTFQEHPHGTEVSVNVLVKVGIPGFQAFADAYIKKLLSRNFEAILEAIERRVISIKYASLRKGDTEKVSGFGFIGHLYNANHLEKALKTLNPNFKMPSREFIGQLFDLTPSFKMHDVVDFRSKTGETVNGCCIMATFIPEMMEKDIWSIFSKVVKACKIAEKHGVGVVSLGGFTSIVGERIGHEVANEVDVPVTTGNTFTAAMAIDGVLKAVQILDRDLSSLKATIVGGTGDIGSACARVLAEKVKQLTITGRTKRNLNLLKAELGKKRKAKIIATTDNRSAVKDADIVIAAAASASTILEIDWFKPGSIICDVGYPKNISHANTARQDILIFSGGLTKSPTPITFPIDTGLPATDVLYGCFAEAIILALEKRFENFSFGRGKITLEKIEEIRAMGKKHGFEVSDFYWGDKLVDESIINKVREAIKLNPKK
jgi:predicted amino acid dehydrogenase/ribosome-associated toxin RatA of RatAB toxin-antitoxin module